MRMIYLLFLISTTSAFSQTSIKKDTLKLENGLTYYKDMDVKIGMGSNMVDKSFNYIYTNPMSFAGKMNLGAGWSGHKFRIKEVRSIGTKKRGYKNYLVLAGGNLVSYYCEIEQALTTGEITDDRLKKETPKQVANGSLADELKKLKDLLDSGAITKDEYEAAKKKLLQE